MIVHAHVRHPTPTTAFRILLLTICELKSLSWQDGRNVSSPRSFSYLVLAQEPVVLLLCFRLFELLLLLLDWDDSPSLRDELLPLD